MIDWAVIGADGPQLPPVDDDRLIQGVEDAGVRISNNHTGHGTLLAWDQIHHYASDPARGDRNGFLILNTQVNIGGNSLWTEPTFRPGEALPDPFGDARGWKRAKTTRFMFRTCTVARFSRRHRPRRRKEPLARVLPCS